MTLWLYHWDQLKEGEHFKSGPGFNESLNLEVFGTWSQIFCCFHDAIKTHFYMNWAFKRIQYYYINII